MVPITVLDPDGSLRHLRAQVESKSATSRGVKFVSYQLLALADQALDGSTIRLCHHLVYLSITRETLAADGDGHGALPGL